MVLQAVFVHGIRTSSTMWRAQVGHLAERGIPSVAVDLPAHGTRILEAFVLDEAFATIDAAVRDAATRGPVLLVGHSMGGLLSIAYAGREDPPPVAGFIAASCTAFPRGAGLAAYRLATHALTALPDQGRWIADRVLEATLPLETRADFGAGGYAFFAQNTALKSLAALDLPAALRRISVPTWFVNGQYDQLRVNEQVFCRLVPHAELIVVPRTTHLVTAMRPRVFNAVLDLAAATLQSADPARTPT
ncbi:alpha/beta hydrolase [Microbacterium protaetiae]|uniref:Alpha/beta hydrolase n=1 Tax=Microbacterium protaetiae TaxID=2509458 RepID=A0A4P6EHH4_9MICO|nr:alpha/beta hydrolase [Microbacterium protaetiae]QAY61366.1 alpha/beta hydrolase [Microbacterium protaetiae]